MSTEKKDLGDKLDDALDKTKKAAKEAADDVKEAAGKAADNVKEAAEKAKDKAKDFADDTKEAAKDFAQQTKDTANEFSDNVEKSFTSGTPEAGKNVAIIAHLTLIGWIIALIMNNGDNKTSYGSFYIRQMLGLLIMALVLGFIPVVGWILNIGVIILWVISLVNAFSGNEKPVPGVGPLFQSWFAGL